MATSPSSTSPRCGRGVIRHACWWGPTGTDHRLAEVAWFVAEIRRYGPAAAPYFSSLARAANPSGSIFDERPRSVAGNVEAVEGEGELDPRVLRRG